MQEYNELQAKQSKVKKSTCWCTHKTIQLHAHTKQHTYKCTFAHFPDSPIHKLVKVQGIFWCGIGVGTGNMSWAMQRCIMVFMRLGMYYEVLSETPCRSAVSGMIVNTCINIHFFFLLSYLGIYRRVHSILYCI